MSSKVLWRCDECGGPANWTIIRGAAHYFCRECSTQLELFEAEQTPSGVVVKTTTLDDGNFPHESEYEDVRGERQWSDSPESDLPF